MQTTKATAILRLDMDGDPWGTTMNHLALGAPRWGTRALRPLLEARALTHAS